MRHRFCARQCASWLLLSMASTVPVLAQTATADPADQDTVAGQGGHKSVIRSKPASKTLEQVKVEGQTSSTYSSDDTNAATRLPLSLLDTPQSVSIMSRQRMTDQQLNSVRAVLDNTTGVQSNAYDSERVVYWSRGFQIENMAYDGVPVASGLNVSSVDGSLDTSVYDRVEVVRGATGLLSGSGSPSAMVNFVRKQADSKTAQADISVSYGSWATKRLTADGSTPLNKSGTVRGRLVVTHEDGNTYQTRARNNKNVLYGVVDWDISPKTLLSVGYEYQRSMPRGITWGSFPVLYADGGQIPLPRNFNPAARWTYWNNMTQSAFIDLKHEFANGWQIHGEVDHRKTNADSVLFYSYGFPDRTTGEGITPYAYKSYQSGRQNMFDLYASGPVWAFGREHELVGGIYTSDFNTDSYQFPTDTDLGTIDFNHWNGNYPYPDFSSQKQMVTLTHIKQEGAYIAARIQLADPLKLVTGARYTRWSNDTNDATYGVYNETKGKVVPYAGLIYNILPDLTAFASYTKIFDPQTNRGANGAYLEPMVGTSSEVGIKSRNFNGALNTSLTFFNTRESNVAQAIPGEYLADGITQVYEPLNGTRSRGFEFETSGSITDNWNATLGISHYNIKAPGYGNVHPSLPRATIRSFTTYTLPGAWSGLSVGGGVNWQNATNIPVADVDNLTRTIHQRSVMLLGLMARYAFNNRMSLQINGDNLLHKKYFIADDSSDFAFGQPASFMVTFNYKFF